MKSAILRSAGLSIIGTDPHGIIQSFNAGAERLLGYAANEVVGKISVADLHDPAGVAARAEAMSLELATTIAPGFSALACKAARGIEDSYALAYVGKDGSRIPSIVSITAMQNNTGDGANDAAGTLTGYVLISADNTGQVRTAAQLTTAKEAAEKDSLKKSDFLVALSHELRTPLNAILGFAQLIESGVPPPPPSQQENLKQILVAGRYLLELSNEILELAMLESRETPVSREPVSLAEVMRECQSMIEPQAKRRHVGMSFPRFEAPCFVKADLTRLKQVLMNLLLNAIKYNRPGGAVAVSCAASPRAPGSTRISIRDTGKGLTPEQLAQLFQPFNRLGQQAGQEEGAGIGLVISKQLLALMGGTIGAESTVGQGCVFWIDLSTALAPALAVPHVAYTAPAAAPADAPVCTVLYVEDNPANLQLVRQLIARRADLRLLTAINADLGIASARANLPQLILMDVNLPGLGGTEAMRIMRRDPSTAHIPIVALSANAMQRDIERGIEAGFFNYVTKPIKVDVFMAAIDAALLYSPSAPAREIPA